MEPGTTLFQHTMIVTLVTPSFNQARFLGQTIRSVLNQTGVEIEYIIVDGGSTDGSIDVIRRYAERLAWWVSEPDGGQADAIRKGFARARGDILAWVNSDDVLAPGAVAEAAALLAANPEAGFVYGNAVSIDADGSLMNDMLFRQYTKEDLAAFNIICQPAVFMRRSAYLEAGGIDLDYHFLLDHHLWLRIAGSSPFVFAPKAWAFARQHATAKNVALAEKFGSEAHRIVSWLTAAPAYAGVAARHGRRIRAAALRFDARYLLDGGLAGKSFLTYLRALGTHPPTALKEWQRILFALLSMLGLGRLGKIYYGRKHARGSKICEGVKNVAELV